MTALDFFNHNLAVYLEELKTLTAFESPTGDLESLGAAADYLEELFTPMGELDRSTIPDHGPLLHLRRAGRGARVALLAHYDTVWPVGSWSQTWREEDGRVFGPGVYDMKGGLLFILWALRYLDANRLPAPPIEVLLTPDEEVGAPGSRPSIEEVARRSDAVLVLEPSNLEGHLKLARKGSGEYVVTIHGQAAHQGVEPEAGVNAVVEASHQVVRMLELENAEIGTTVGPNVFNGGTASNMVPDRAEVRVDVRAWTADETQRLDRALRGLEPHLDGTQVHVFGGWNRPPMEPSAESLDLFEGVRNLGANLGLDLQWLRWGGSSDANVAAAVGVPTIDGLGPIGEGSHQFSESILVDELPRRMALFAELLHSLSFVDQD
ncbi:MAG: M20 family metallopeptidase [Holophagae bacterium]|jgi:glutamate carboxypeptidase